jgi:hypothetical protein
MQSHANEHAQNIVATDIIMRVGVSRMGQTRRCENGGVLDLYRLLDRDELPCVNILCILPQFLADFPVG